ncbi:MAG: MerR family DNA-binding protein [Enterobacterales bacterium]|nr:MerR family DNA-binding protein [Enterobacterales bacterium]
MLSFFVPLSKILEATTSLTQGAVRFYTKKGLLNPVKSALNGYKIYSKREKEKLRFIVNARKMGFSIKDIETMLYSNHMDNSGCPQVSEIIERRLIEAEQQFQQVKHLREQIKLVVSKWEPLKSKTSLNNFVSHLVDCFMDESQEHEYISTTKRAI